MTHNLFTVIVFATLLLTICTSNKQAVDFSYAELQQGDPTNKHTQDIDITPQPIHLNKYEFPQTWQLSELLQKSIKQETPLSEISNFNQDIQFIKQHSAQYLKLSTKAQLLVKNIRQLPEMKHDPLLTVSDEQFAVIQNHQNKLTQLNQQIATNSLQLQKIVNDLMIQQQNPLFKQSQLAFQRKALQSKITLLQQLLVDTNSQTSVGQRRDNQNRLNEYFVQLENIFKTENGLIDAIDTLLKNHNQLTILKAKVTSLTSQLKAHELTLTEKQQCQQQFIKIKQKQHNDKQLFKLIRTLKEKKDEFNEPNKYCQGVEKKLIDRIKKLLIGYDYVYQCASQLQHVLLNRNRVKHELQQAQQKLDQLQLQRGVQQFRRTFENNRQVISSKINQLKEIKLDEFYMYPNGINAAIAHAESRIGEIDMLVDNLPSKSIQNLNAIQQLIVNKVDHIQGLKARYCEQNQSYNDNAEIIQSRITKLQQQQEYNEWIRKIQVQKLQELQKIKQEMKQIENIIVQYLVV